MIRIFCDFDGTVSTEDIGAEFFRTFAGKNADGFTEESLPGKLTMQNWLTQLCGGIDTINRSDFDRFTDKFMVDPHFAGFVQFADKNQMSLTIVSDGLDAYIERVLANSGLSGVRFFANHAEFVGLNGNQRLTVSFPYTDSECALCGNCKRNHMLTKSADEDIIIYVGDGYSDQCPARYADFVFAKGQLIKYCQKQNITFFEFSDFRDVLKKTNEIFQKKHIRHRREAQMARREVFMQG